MLLLIALPALASFGLYVAAHGSASKGAGGPNCRRGGAGPSGRHGEAVAAARRTEAWHVKGTAWLDSDNGVAL